MTAFGYEWPPVLNCEQFPFKNESICEGGKIHWQSLDSLINNKAFRNVFRNLQNRFHTFPSSSDPNNRGYRFFFPTQQ